MFLFVLSFFCSAHFQSADGFVCTNAEIKGFFFNFFVASLIFLTNDLKIMSWLTVFCSGDNFLCFSFPLHLFRVSSFVRRREQ